MVHRSVVDDYPPYTRDSIGQLLQFLPAFEKGDFQDAADIYLAGGRNPPLVDKFGQAVYQSGFVFPFDWARWNEGRKMTSDDVAQADVLTLRKLLTALVRSEHFHGGALADYCASGFVEQILRRLRELESQE